VQVRYTFQVVKRQNMKGRYAGPTQCRVHAERAQAEKACVRVYAVVRRR